MKKIGGLIAIAMMLFAITTACGPDTESFDDRRAGEAGFGGKTIVKPEFSLVKYDKNQLVHDADVIVEGIVVSWEVQEDFEGFPVTDFVLEVTKVYKGHPGKTVEIRTYGGETERMIFIPDEEAVPRFEKNEKVVVFLTGNKGERPDKDDFGYFVVGQPQGKFHVSEDGILSNDYMTFDYDRFQDELRRIEIENEKNRLQKLHLEDGRESDI